MKTTEEIKAEFIKIYSENIHREGSDKLLDYLLSKSDFFTAPASTRFHNSFEGGLALHSLNVYYCLKDYLARERVQNEYGLKCSEETAAIAALLHDICKTNVYVRDFRNVKNEQGQWERVPTYRYEDKLPYGHGEKSVYMISGFMRLTREEAMAIRWHMGFSGTEEKSTVSSAIEKYPLILAVSAADMEATVFMEKG
ncbi:MAG TPA: hydrolase [Ruminococcaceae bacterium]|nr:hydrolase [Oscillospiraceae bacterium]